MHRFARVAVPGPAPRLDFNERHNVAGRGHEVHLAEPVPVSARQDPVPLRFEVPRGEILACLPERLSAPRHRSPTICLSPGVLFRMRPGRWRWIASWPVRDA